jgi:hypothetical protein
MLDPHMKAAVYRPGVVQIQDVEKPVPKDDQVLVRVHATTIFMSPINTLPAGPLSPLRFCLQFRAC